MKRFLAGAFLLTVFASGGGLFGLPLATWIRSDVNVTLGAGLGALIFGVWLLVLVARRGPEESQ